MEIDVPDLADGVFLTSIDRLYAAALGAAGWPDFLSAAATLFSASNAYVSQIEHDKRSLNYTVLHPLDWNAISVNRYAELMNDDPRIAGFRANPGRAVQCRSVTSERELHSSRIYQEALKPLDIEYTMLVGLPEGSSGITNYIGLTRGINGMPFAPADCALLTELIPHVSRALTVRNTLADARRQRTALQQVLDCLPHAAFVTDSRGTIFHMNTPANAMEVPSGTLRVSDGRMYLMESESQHRFLEALETVTTPGSTSQLMQSFNVSGNNPLTLTVAAFPAAADSLVQGDGARLALVSVQRTGRRNASDKDRLRHEYGLSPAQLQLALLIGDGFSIKEACKSLGITEGSARQYLKIIFSKTGTRRQADLVRVIVNAGL